MGLIRVPTDESVPAPFADDAILKAGQRVIAIGNPLGLERTVSDGLISGIRKDDAGVELIQTTVPISPGSSGGVLLNEQGTIIGITTSTFTAGQNINFAISINTIRLFIEKSLKADKSEFKELKPARDSVWYRVLLKWIGKIAGFLITLIFGSTIPLVILIIVIIGYIIYGFVKGIKWIVSYPFRKFRERKETAALQSSKEREYYPSTNVLSGDIDDSDFMPVAPEKVSPHDAGDTYIDFFCPKCGYKHILPHKIRGSVIKCSSCFKSVTVPIE